MDNLTERDPRTYSIIGAAMEVHRQLSCGFLESVYQEAFALELRDREIPFIRELNFPVTYNGRRLNAHYRPDFICFEEVVVELKALSKISSVDESQLLNYLKSDRSSYRANTEFRHAELTTTPLRFGLTKRRCFGPQSV